MKLSIKTWLLAFGILCSQHVLAKPHKKVSEVQLSAFPASAKAALNLIRPKWTPGYKAIGCFKEFGGWVQQIDLNDDGNHDYIVKIKSNKGNGFFGIVSNRNRFDAYLIYESDNIDQEGMKLLKRGQHTNNDDGSLIAINQPTVMIGPCGTSAEYYNWNGSGFSSF